MQYILTKEELKDLIPKKLIDEPIKKFVEDVSKSVKYSPGYYGGTDMVEINIHQFKKALSELDDKLDYVRHAMDISDGQ